MVVSSTPTKNIIKPNAIRASGGAAVKLPSFFLAMILVGSAQAADVSIQQNSVILNANLEKSHNWPQGPTVLLTHGTLAHGRMEITTAIQSLLKERDISSLSINLGLGLSDRRGMYDCKTPHTHRHEDAMDEIGLWLDWLKQQGSQEVVLMGHSRGGNQTAWFAAERDDDLISKVILVAPGTWTAEKEEQGYQKRYGKALGPILAKAQELVESGKGDTSMGPLDFIYCEQTHANADSVVSYYAPDPRKNTPYLLPKINKPVLVFAGSEDNVVANLVEQVEPLAQKGVVRLEVLDGADHFFRDLYAEDLADMAQEFISE
jgi:pimeloyl-ACP methyl ester carboxylesterase